MSNTLISVIVPAYNIEKYIENSIESIVKQTYSDIEIIVVDDGSIDKTPMILDELAKKYVSIKAIHKENGGVTSARLQGVTEASGDWIGFADGDDYIEPDMYERLMNNALKHDADISHCGYQMVFPSGRIDYYYNTGKIVLQDKLDGLKDLLSGEFVEPGLGNKLYRKTMFEPLVKNNVMDMSIKNNEDLLMNYYLFSQANNSIYEDFCPYHYVLRKGSAATSRLNEHKLKDPLKVLDVIQESIGDTQLKAVMENRYVRQLITVSILPLRTQKELVAPYRKEIRKRLRKRLTKVLSSKDINSKLKGMALWVSLCPMSYYLVHRIYEKLTGLDKKYSLE